MDLSVNGQSQVPPGFRFHPTEEELVHYYLRKKVSLDKVDLDVIPDVDLNKLEPWDIQEKCKIGSTPQNDWYLFSHKDKKYPTGTRTNRATAAGFWKATGRDKVIHSNGKRIGMRKTLVFYRGRAPHGLKSDWIMHEYRLDDDNNDHHFPNGSDINGDQSGVEEGWVVCRVFKKKNYPMKASSSQLLDPTINPPSHDNIIIDQILNYMERSSSSNNMICKQENLIISNNEEAGFSHLPGLVDRSGAIDNMMMAQIGASNSDCVASQINGHSLKQFGAESINNEEFSFCFDHQDEVQLVNMNVNDSDEISNHEISSLDNDFWAFARSSSSLSSDPLSHLSV